MALTQILIDSGFLYVLYDTKHSQHKVARTFLEMTPAEFLIPYIVLTETAYLFRRDYDVPGVMRFLASLVTAKPQFQPIELADLERAREIMGVYTKARFDFVDCCIMALCESLNVTKVCTVDRRDFSMFRPKHCTALELLP